MLLVRQGEQGIYKPRLRMLPYWSSACASPPQLAQSALLAGARGLLQLGMKPAQVVYVFSEASKGKVIVPRQLLEAFLLDMESRGDLAIVSPRQREILMLIAEAATREGEIVLSREVLENFLMEVTMVSK
jgi:hypothetical protein